MLTFDPSDVWCNKNKKKKRKGVKKKMEIRRRRRINETSRNKKENDSWESFEIVWNCFVDYDVLSIWI